jgi:hypothetical protein
MYFVTHEEFSPRGAAIDVAPRGLSLEHALGHAQNLMAEGKNNVTIIDNKGNSITGADLVACCEGRKILSHDLRAS